LLSQLGPYDRNDQEPNWPRTGLAAYQTKFINNYHY